jgi:hypothetical protein
MDDALGQDSHVENLVDVIVNEIARSGLDELAVVQRIAQRNDYDLRELTDPDDVDTWTNVAP